MNLFICGSIKIKDKDEICYYDLAEHMQKYLSLAMEKFKPKLADGPRELLDDIWEEAMKIRGRYTH